MRIAHLTTVDMSLALLLSTELAADIAAGHEVYGLSAPGPYVAQVEALGVRHEPIPSFTRAWSLPSDLAAARELVAAIRRLRPDVLHTHTPKAGVLGRVVGRALRVPVLVNTCHGLWATEDNGRLRRALVLAVEGVAAQFSHEELFQNAADQAALSWALRGSKGRVVGNGIDLDRFRFDPDGRARVRAEWGIAPDAVVVGGVGRRVAEKGIRELSAAAAAVGDLASFVWVGPGDDDKPDALPVDGGGPVRFLGPRDDMPAVYSALDIFVLPSHREGYSRSAMEAAACARPMVLSDIRGCREIGDHETHLILVPPRNAATLAGAITQLVGDPGLRRRLGEAAAARARVEFDQRRVAAESLEAYARVAARRR